MLSEIGTCWRRAHGCLPGLPVALPLELGDASSAATSRQVIRKSAGTGAAAGCW
jgi:hypothetical protein